MKKLLLGIAGLLIALAGGYQATNMIGAGVYTGERTVMNEVATTTVGTEFLTNDYTTVIFTVSNTSASGTHKFACSDQEDVDFATAASATNRWDYIETINREDGSSFDGDTGWVATNNSEVRSFRANIDGAYYCTAMWTRTSGTSSVYMRPYNNQ